MHSKLCRNIRAQPHIGQDFQAFYIATRMLFGATKDHPARAKASEAVGFGEAVEADDEDIITQRSHWSVYGIVIDYLAVNLVCKKYELMLATYLDQLQ